MPRAMQSRSSLPNQNCEEYGGRWNEIEANALMEFVSFIPFFALLEVHRMFGVRTLFDVFFRGQRRSEGAAR